MWIRFTARACVLQRERHVNTFKQSYLAKGKIAPVVVLLHEAKHMILHWRIRTGSDWWFSKILRIRTGSDSIVLDQDWTRTEKFHSPLISASHQHANVKNASPCCGQWCHSWVRLGGGHRGRVLSTSSDVPHIFLFRFCNILVSHQAVPLTFYNKIALIVPLLPSVFPLDLVFSYFI